MAPVEVQRGEQREEIRMLKRSDRWSWICCTVLVAFSQSAPQAAEPVSAAALGAGFEDRYADVGDVRIHYVTGGSGPTVLLVPGWPETWYAWRHIMPALAHKYTVVAVDTRGMGDSSRPSANYDMTSIVADLQQLMSQRGERRFHFIGHDIGVWIGYAMAADHPEMIDRLVLIDSNIPGVSASPSIFRAKADNTHSWHFMFNQLDDLPEMLVAGREREYLSWLYSNYAYRPGAVAMDEYTRAYSMPGAMRAGFAYYRALPQTIEQNQRRMQARLEMPILAVGGDHGTADTAEQTLRPHASNLHGAVLAACGHYVPEECPQPLLEHLLPFLAEGDRKGR
jgi:pimeloyl-ACP methyl ester carboxylesterase